MARFQLLHYLSAGGYQRKRQRPETEADHKANQLLFYRTMTGCDPGRLQLTPICSLFQSARPAYTRRLCQVSNALQTCLPALKTIAQCLSSGVPISTKPKPNFPSELK